MALIELKNLHKSYTQGKESISVLADVSFSVNAGEIIILLGKSGSGKSTFLNLISGIDSPDQGEIRFYNRSLAFHSEAERTLFRRKNIGFIFQFFNLIPTLTVRDNLLLPLELNNLLPAEKDQVDLLLEKLSLKNKENQYPDTLSGGEQQRIAIARAIIHNPELVLADEPTGNLDDSTSAQVIHILLQFIKSYNKTLIMATHNKDLCRIADRIIQIRNGHLEEISGEVK